MDTGPCELAELAHGIAAIEATSGESSASDTDEWAMRSVRKEVWLSHDPHLLLEQCSSEVRGLILENLWRPVELRIHIPIQRTLRDWMIGIGLEERGAFETGH